MRFEVALVNSDCFLSLVSVENDIVEPLTVAADRRGSLRRP